jgi:prepilin-type N-terminal cleavage/methylation domain-containing protein
MNVQETTKNKGFTIIEVVLVLAIAGLIFLMVFIALPALQRNQRDTARKNDGSSISAAVNSYVGNNRGAFPNNAALRKYSTDVSDNIDNSAITIAAYSTSSVSISDRAVKVVTGATCGATGALAGTSATQTIAAGSKRQYVTILLLESGGGTSYCLNS